MPAIAQETERDSMYLLTPVEVRSVRAGERSPFTRTNLSKADLSRLNLGQDIPFLFNQTPSVVVHADAGNGIGYTGLRIRGTDATRINITLNGIPYNDAESQGTFFVNLPDFTSSAGSVQVQRGVGTSSNGAGAFGASIHFSTNEVNREAYAEINNGFGSFHTWKHTLKAGTGLIGERFTADLRLSKISSDGYIDRASSDLKAFYASTAWLAPKTSIRFNVFSGDERTYQAWYGVSQSDLDAGRRRINPAGTSKPGTPYENETDNYRQTHYQLFVNRTGNDRLHWNAALFLTRGKGYYEQYRADEGYERYGLSRSGNTDLVRQLWLDNHFYGTTFSLQYRKKRTEATLGGAVTRYDGRHFGELIWASNGLPTPTHRWYDLDAFKNDHNLYLKHQQRFHARWSWYYDLQYRGVRYNIYGFRNNPGLVVRNDYHFLNPKAGVTYSQGNWKGYLSFGVASKEPNRDDFEAGQEQQPRPERLFNVEASLQRDRNKSGWSATLYYMRYRDQLVLSGRINDVGAYTRTNIPNSYRAGVELQGRIRPYKWLMAAGNLTLSRNRVRDLTEYIDDYDNGGQQTINHDSAPISFSPDGIASTTLTFFPFKSAEIGWISKWVSRQYLDNTGQRSRSLDPFTTHDLRLSYELLGGKMQKLSLVLQCNNVFNRQYEPNGYTFSYILGGETITENFYFPMAGLHVLAGLNLRL
jgi:iron complex outermembrane receptor protein